MKTKIYGNLTNEEVQKIAVARFGNVLRPLKELGREAVIEELKAYDRFLRIKEVKMETWKQR